MISKWIPVGLAVGLLAAAITGGAVLASGGEPKEGGEGEPEEVVVKDGDFAVQSIANDDVDPVGEPEPDELFVRIAEILGTDPEATHDAMVQADQVDLNGSADDSTVEVGDADSMSVEAGGTSYLEYGKRVGAILGVDGRTVAEAIAQAWEELYAVQRDITDKGSGQDAEDKYGADKYPGERNGTGD